MLAVGDSIPDVTVNDADGNPVRLRSLRGKPMVLYFYPRDNTPGCTQEACDFRDLQRAFAKLDATVIGVSADSEASHQRFAAKHDLPFTLLSDPEHVLLEACGAWQEKSMYGRTFMGIVRSTFLFDARGKLQHVWPKVRVKEHAADVLAVLSGSPAAASKKKATKKKATKTKATKKKAAKTKATKKKAAKTKATKKKAAKKKATKKKAAKKKAAKKKAAKKKAAKTKAAKTKAAKTKATTKKAAKTKATRASR